MKLSKTLTVSALAVLALASCSKSDMFSEEKIREIEKQQAMAQIEQKKADFAANFVKVYGEVPANQSWDLSSGAPAYTLPAAQNNARRAADQRASSYTRTNSTEFYEIEDQTIAKMKKVFVEGRNNQNLGTSFGMLVPDNAFTIVPLYMGQSGGDFDLYMHVDGIAEDILVWSKWEGMQVKGKNKNGRTVNTWTDLETFDNSSNCTNATAIRSKYVTFANLPVGAKMYFYLKITSAATGYNQKGAEMSSLNDQMREYQFQTDELPSSLPGVENPEVKIVGCEDANTSKSDWDYNDVVFMIYGKPYVPQSFEVTEVEKTYSKRYMIEDLGTTDDFDFNDVVVDVYETYTQQKTSGSNGKVTWGPETLQGQKAILRHLGGTLPFELTIGNTTLDKMGSQELFKTDPNTEFTITGWDRTANNISIKVYQSADSQYSAEVNFPQNGAIPMIISTDTNVEWAVERVKFNWKDYMNTTAEEE